MNISEKKITRLAPVILVFLFCLQVFVASFWLSKHPAYFGAELLDISLNYTDALEQDGATGWIKEAARSDHYPPGYVALAGILHWLFGFSRLNFLWLNAIFLAMAAAGTFGIGKHIAGTGAGFSSALLLMFCPGFCLFMPIPMTEIALVGPTALCVWALVKSSRFTDRKIVALFAFSFAIGMYFKWNTFIVLLSPIIYFFAEQIVTGIRHGRNWRTLFLKKIQWTSIGLCVGLILALLAPWYLFSMNWGSIGEATQTDPTVTAGIFGWALYYLLNIESTVIPPIMAWLFSAAIIIGFFAPVRKKQWLVVFWFFGGYLLFSIIPHKEARYIFWFLVPMTILVSTGALSIPKKPIGFLFLSLMIVFSAIWYGIKQADPHWIPTDNGQIVYLENPSCTNRVNSFFDRIAEGIQKDWGDASGVVSVATHPFNKKTKLFGDEVTNLLIHLYNRKNNQPKINKFGYTLNEYERFYKDLPRTDYLLINESTWKAKPDQHQSDIALWKYWRAKQNDGPMPPEDDPGLIRAIKLQYKLIEQVTSDCFYEIKILKQKSNENSD